LAQRRSWFKRSAESRLENAGSGTSREAPASQADEASFCSSSNWYEKKTIVFDSERWERDDKKSNPSKRKMVEKFGSRKKGVETLLGEEKNKKGPEKF